MSIRWVNWKAKNGKMVNMDNITSDFACLKISALEKASRISAEINNITIGPQSVVNKSNNADKLENIENEQNSCNIKNVQNTDTSPKHHLVSAPNVLHFSANKIHLESELQRKEEVRKNIQRHIQHMNENDRAIQREMAKSRSSMAQERELRSAEKLARIIAEEERIAEQEEIKRRHEQQLHAQRIQEQKERLKQEEEEYRKRMKEKEELIKAVVFQRNQFTTKYYDIMALSKTCKNKHAFNMLLMTNASRLEPLCQQVETMDVKITSGDLIVTDLKTIDTLVCYIDDILNLFQTETEKADVQYESELACKAQISNELQPIVENTSLEKMPHSQQANENVAEKMDKNQNLIATVEQESATVSNVIIAPITTASDLKSEEIPKNSTEYKEGHSYEYMDKESLQIYIKSMQFLAIYKESCNDFLQSADTKKFRLELQRAISIPVNTISGISEQHLKDKYDRLQNLLTGKSSPNVMQHPQGTAFCKDQLAEKIVNQGERLICTKPEMAFPIAAIMVALWNEHSDFGELFLAHLHEACPFIVPVSLSQREGQSNEDYNKFLGYKYSEDGTVEEKETFLNRMSGLMRLYASITITEQRRGLSKTHPHGLQHAWRWLAAISNIEPKPDTCSLSATLILSMLEVAGNMLWTAYPKQFPKLVTLLVEQYYPRMQNMTSDVCSGPLLRLKGFLSRTVANGTIRPPVGLLPSNFW